MMFKTELIELIGYLLTLDHNLITAVLAGLAGILGTYFTYRTKIKEGNKNDFQILLAANEQYRKEVKEDLIQSKAEIETCKKLIKEYSDRIKELEDKIEVLVCNNNEVKYRLELANNRFIKLSNTLPIFIFRTDKNGQVFFVNDYCVKLIGRPAEELCNGKWKDVIYKDDVEAFFLKWDDAIKTHTNFEHEYRIYGANNSIIYLKTRLIREEDINGKILGYVGSGIIQKIEKIEDKEVD